MTRGARAVYLVCMKESSSEAMTAIRAIWPENQHYELDSTQVLVASPHNGGKSVYERIADELEGEFIALIVRVRSGDFQGRHRTGLWEWLAANVAE